MRGFWERSPQPPEAGGLGEKPPAAGGKGSGSGQSPRDWAIFFSIKIKPFYAYFSPNSYFKEISHQLKAFKICLNVLNGINEVKVL